MFTVFGFLTKKDDLSMQEFIDHYENKHVQLICDSAPAPLVYKRRYLAPNDRLTSEGGEVDFHVMTELVFANRSVFEAWMADLLSLKSEHVLWRMKRNSWIVRARGLTLSTSG